MIPMPAAKPRIALVIPVYNEAEGIAHNLHAIWQYCLEIQEIDFTLLVVDDGSRDDTVAEVMRLQHPQLHLISLRRNCGKEAAIHAGLAHCEGNAAIVMDSDLQHPPALIADMARLWRQGMMVVEGVKIDRGQEPLASRWLANGFYRLFAALSGLNIANHSDFKLLDRQVINAYLALPERQRFFRGLVHWLAFPAAQLPFAVPPRCHGNSAWSKLRLLHYSITAITTFSTAPLHLVTLLGFFTFALALSLGALVIHQKLAGLAISGFSTVILLILLIGSILMFALGLIGVYVAHIYDEIKGRPPFLIHTAPQVDSLKKKG